MTTNHDNPIEHRDDIADLLRAAGPRRPVPSERAQRVRAAAHAQWRSEVRLRSRRRVAWVAAGLAAAASLVALITLRIPMPMADSLRVEALRGRVSIHGPSGDASTEVHQAVMGDLVDVASRVETSDAGRVALRLASGHSVRLDTATIVRVLEAGSLALDRGAVYVDSGADGLESVPVTLHTPLGVVRDIGTQFEVRVEDDSVRVRVREGAVVVTRGDHSHEVRLGNELTLDEDGPSASRPIDSFAAEWDWTSRITPGLDIQGLSARAFLDWAAREGGWQLTFADDALAATAEEISLSGTIEGLTLQQALGAVLPTCLMVHRVEGGLLVVAGESESDG